MGMMIELAAADGFRLAAYRADPAGVPRGSVVVAQEIFGVNSHIKSVCDGFAADGYLAMAPALFDRVRRGVDLGYSPDDIAVGRELKAAATTELALLDIDAARAAAAGAGNTGLVGYCWGGYITWMAAARLPGLACAVSYYGGGMTDAIGEQPRCPVMMHFGREDAMIPVPGVERLQAAHPAHQVHLYAANHGFNCDQRASFNAEAAALARTRTLGFFREHIG
ncbi:MAG: dienelactone hydrolase family protein [Betaproteobacteria bacterium]|nr:dienelactone hydrolase family protein [Betaproteobacteria bacterium]